MDISKRALRLLLPRSWKIGDNLSAVINALSLSVQALHDFYEDILVESNPGTAVDTLSEWYAALNIKYDATKSLSIRQKRARQVYSNVGGSSIGYLNEQLQIAYPEVYLEEVHISPEFMAGSGMAGKMMASDYPSWLSSPPSDGTYPYFYYRVNGFVEDTWDLNGIYNILARIMPVLYEPSFNVTVRNLTPTAEAGLGMAGLMMAGREA